MKLRYLTLSLILLIGAGCRTAPSTLNTNTDVVEPRVHIVSPDVPTAQTTTSQDNEPVTSTAPILALSTTTIRVAWHTPVLLPKVNLFGKDAPTTTYWSVGAVRGGEYDGADFVRTSLDVCITGAGPEEVGYYRFIRTDKGTTLITNYSSEVNYDDEFCATWNVVPSVTQRPFVITDLVAPQKLTDAKTHQTFTLDPISVTELMPTYRELHLVPLFTDVSGRTVFYDQQGNDTDVYLRVADGSTWRYAYDAPAASLAKTANHWEVSPIKWVSGLTNTSTIYEFDDGANDCRRIDETYDFANKTTVSQSDLVVAGTAKDNSPVYVLKDTAHPLIANLREAKDNMYGTGPMPQNAYIFWQDPFGRVLRLINSLYIEGCGGKPVIYLYPSSPMAVHVQVAPMGGFTRTVPQYPAGGWSVFADPSGRIEYQSKNYPYLFWEGGLGSYQSPKQGFIVAASKVSELLTDKLSTIGLNDQEIRDFKAFWVPRLSSDPYYFITFTVNSDIETFAPLTINPRPDTVIRVLMDYQPLQSPISVEPLPLTHTDRHGFTVVEWGGNIK